MRSGARHEHTAFAGLLFGVLFFPLLQLASQLVIQEGLITFWFERSLGLRREAPAEEPVEEVVAPPPDRTRPIAAMIDDHPDALPQSGVAKAAQVWEALVEGGLTRDMAIFRAGDVEEIGPVRSARPYFLEWAREADAVYAHVGGSDEALADLASGKFGLDDVNEFAHGSSFWRDAKRSAPHNAYTSTERLRALIDAKGWETETDAVDASLRADLTATGTPATRIDIAYARNGSSVQFRWDPSAGGYQLWRGGRQAFDRDGTPVIPSTVVAIKTDVLKIADPYGKGLIGLKTIGAGQAIVFRDGVAVGGTWKKTSAADATQVFGADGKKIPFAPGQLWFSVIGDNRGGTVDFSDGRQK